MGYGFYLLPDGREAGYGVDADCDHPDCDKRIDRGLGYLCGRSPDGHRDPGEPGCGNYFCGDHQGDHSCSNPACDLYEDEGMGGCCDLARGHDLPHFDSSISHEFEDTEDDTDPDLPDAMVASFSRSTATEETP